MVNTEHDTCIIGAGWSGLLACKHFKAEGFNPIVLERNSYIGGVWRHDPERVTGGVLASTYTTSSKLVTEMSDYPMPDDFPDFPRHSQIMAYLQAYHDHFDLGPHIRLGSGARRVEKADDGWRVEADDGEIFVCARVVVCSGVHQEAADSGRGLFTDFDGTVIHSTRLEEHLPGLHDKRVLIVGSGETASDVSAELSRITPHLAMSSPNGQWIVPRVASTPTQRPFLLDHLSSPIRQAIDPFDAPFWAAFEIEYANGRCGSGVPEWQTSAPYLSQFLNKNPAPVQLWRDGQLTPRPRVAGVDGSTVSFVDGAADDYDVVVLCTGFDTVFPFLPAPYDTRAINDHFKLILADDPTLSFVGFARPLVGSIPVIAEMQARCLAAMYADRIPVPGNRDAVIARDKADAEERFCSTRIKGLVEMTVYLDALATWLGVLPDYMALSRARPGDAIPLWTSPLTASRYRLNEPERRDEIVAGLRKNSHPLLLAPALWAFALFVNTFPVNPGRAFTRRRFVLLRTIVGVLGFPFYFVGAFMAYAPSPVTTVLGLLMFVPLLPILCWRLFTQRRQQRELARDFVPSVSAPASSAAA